MKTLFEAFNSGTFVSPYDRKDFADLPWNPHPAFEGVTLKHLLTGTDTGGAFSFHLVRVAPGKSIGTHIHEMQTETHEVAGGSGVCINEGIEIPYAPGTMTILKKGTPHSVTAGSDGLFIFAKFFPPLC